MSKTKHLGLALTGISASDKEKLFSDWRQEINGESEGSNAQIIDAAYKATNDRIIEQSVTAEAELGEIIHVTDAAAVPVKKMKVRLEPKQDLHGYDHPWPAGGGKNKFPYATLEGNGNILLKQPVSIQAGTYIVSCVRNTSEGYFSLTFYDSGDSSVGSVTLYLSNNNNVALTLSGDAKSVTCYAAQNMSVSNVQIEAGSSATEFAPYSNICPITGWEGVTAKDTGVNVWDEEWEVGAYQSSNGAKVVVYDRIRSKNKIPITPSTTYYRTKALQLYYYDVNGNYIGWESSSSLGTFTTPDNCHYLAFNELANSGITYNHDISINYPATDHDYHPYKSRTASVSFPETIYGCTVDLATGEGEIDRAIVDFDGSSDETWKNNGTAGVFIETTFLPGIDAAIDLKITTNQYKQVNAGQATLTNGTFNLNIQHNALQFRNDNALNATDFKALLAQNPLQVCYYLATPTTFTLTPAELELIRGESYITVDAGEITELEYARSTPIIEESFESALAKIGLKVIKGQFYIVPVDITEE